MSESRKTSIARAFAAAAPRYDAAALVQRRVAARLGRHVAALPLPEHAQAVEIGCGTGLLTEHLLRAHPQTDWLITDIAPPMVEACSCRFPGRARFAVMDGEAPELPPCDLIVSSLAVQWFTDLPASLARLADCLKPGGRLLFATLGEGTFAEWRAAHAELGLASGSHDFPSAAALRAMLPGGTVREERLVARHADGRDFVRGLKALGAHVPQPDHRPLPAGAFRRVLRRFAAGCPATYHVLYGEVAR